MHNIFKKMNGCEVDVENYAMNYIKEHPNTKMIVGCDSQNKKIATHYALVLGFYNPGHGAHVLFKKWKTPKERTRSVRLLNEVWASVEIAEELRKAGLPKVTYIDIDINPDERFKSNEVFAQAKGMVEGMGYCVRYKSMAPLITTMADSIVRH